MIIQSLVTVVLNHKLWRFKNVNPKSIKEINDNQTCNILSTYSMYHTHTVRDNQIHFLGFIKVPVNYNVDLINTAHLYQICNVYHKAFIKYIPSIITCFFLFLYFFLFFLHRHLRCSETQNFIGKSTFI